MNCSHKLLVRYTYKDWGEWVSGLRQSAWSRKFASSFPLVPPSGLGTQLRYEAPLNRFETIVGCSDEHRLKEDVPSKVSKSGTGCSEVTK